MGRAANRALRIFGYQVTPGARRLVSRIAGPAPLPEGAAAYLRPDNPRLLELERAYAAFDPRATAPLLWQRGHVQPYDLRYFRGDNAYVWQVRDGAGEKAYALSARCAAAADALGLLGKLEEDGLFGAHAFVVNGRRVSRDLLDSVLEINFLEKQLGVSRQEGFTILDIGAGYGRLAHRALAAWPRLGAYLCADAVAESTFLCEYYLRFRNVPAKAQAIPLHQLEQALAGRRINLAVNIHSFSECTTAAIEWWLDLLARHRVARLMIVPNHADHGGEKLITNARAEMLPLLEARGYRLLAKAPKYADRLAQAQGIQPTWHYLFGADFVKKP